MYAADDETAIKVIDGTAEVDFERKGWRSGLAIVAAQWLTDSRHRQFDAFRTLSLSVIGSDK